MRGHLPKALNSAVEEEESKGLRKGCVFLEGRPLMPSTALSLLFGRRDGKGKESMGLLQAVVESSGSGQAL